MKKNQPFNIKVKNYILLKPVGQGAYSQVIKSKKIGTDKFVAIKLYSDQKLQINPNLKIFIRNELENLEILKDHKNVIKIVETFKEDEYFYVVYNYCEKGNLRNKLDKKKLEEKQILKYIKDLTSIMYHMKKKRIFHRDIKSDNILFNHQGVLKLADFGFSRILDENAKIEGQMGSPVYMAPEMLENKPYGYKADIWSLGCVFYEMVFNECPFVANTISGILKKIYKGVNFSSGKLNEFSNGKLNGFSNGELSDFSKGVLFRMLERDPVKRISIEELFGIFEKINFQDDFHDNLKLEKKVVKKKILMEKKIPIEIRSLSDDSDCLKNSLIKIFKSNFFGNDIQKKIFKINFLLNVLKMTSEKEYDFEKKLSHKSINYIITKLQKLTNNLLEEIQIKNINKKISIEIFLKNIKSFTEFIIKTNKIKIEEKNSEISILRYL